jgi:hypothetical protein
MRTGSRGEDVSFIPAHRTEPAVSVRSLELTERNGV